jgi:hypothetical protein
MIRWHRIIPAVAVTLLLGACGQAGSDTPLSPQEPRFDGGYIVGGNTTPPPPPTEEDASTSGASTGDASVPKDSASRGGYIVGGN